MTPEERAVYRKRAADNARGIALVAARPTHDQAHGLPYGPAEPLPGKGESLCNRMACQRPISGARWWNRITQAYYCATCANRINASSPIDGQPPLCSPETP